MRCPDCFRTGTVAIHAPRGLRRRVGDDERRSTCQIRIVRANVRAEVLGDSKEWRFLDATGRARPRNSRRAAFCGFVRNKI